MRRTNSVSTSERLRRLQKRFPAATLPAVAFLILLVMGLIMLGPSWMHDGAAGRTVCAISGAGLVLCAWSIAAHITRNGRHGSR